MCCHGGQELKSRHREAMTKATQVPIKAQRKVARAKVDAEIEKEKSKQLR